MKSEVSMKILLPLLFAISLLVAPEVSAITKTIFVDKNALGANNGSSWADACVTITNALRRFSVAPTNNIVLINGGVYYDRITLGASQSGSLGRTNIIKGTNGVTVDGRDPFNSTVTNMPITMNGAKFIRVMNINVRYTKRSGTTAGIFFNANNSSNVFYRCIVYKSFRGVHYQGSSKNNTFLNCTFWSNYNDGFRWASMLTTNAVYNCIAQNNAGIGFDVSAGGSPPPFLNNNSYQNTASNFFRVYQDTSSFTSNSLFLSTDPTHPDFLRPATNSPVKGKGIDGSDLGAVPIAALNPNAPPAKPAGFKAVGVSTNSIGLSWFDLPTETSYTLYRSPTMDFADRDFSVSLPMDVIQFTNTGLVTNTTYHFWLRSANSNGSSPLTSVSSATTFAILPDPVSLISVTPVSYTQADILWNSSGRALTYRIYRAVLDDTNSAVLISTVPQGTFSFNDKSLIGGITYHYFLKAVNKSGASAFSSGLSGTTPLPPAPAAPASLTTLAVSTNSVALTWPDVALENAFQIYRSPDSDTNNSVLVASVNANLLKFTNKNLATNTGYTFWVRATNLGGRSAFSPLSSVTTKTVFKAPWATNLIYVDVNAAGLNNGQSWMNAYNKISNMVASLRYAPTNNIVLIAAGVYNESLVLNSPKLTGRLQRTNVLRAYTNGVIIDGTGKTTHGLFLQANIQFCKFENLTVRNFQGVTGNGIHIDTAANNNVIRNVVLTSNKNGAVVWGTKNRFQYCTFYNNNAVGLQVQSAGQPRTNFVRNSILQQNRTYGVQQMSLLSILSNNFNNVFGNTTANYGGAGLVAGPDSLSVDSLFISLEQGHPQFLNLGVGSPCIGSSDEGKDLGAFAFVVPAGYLPPAPEMLTAVAEYPTRVTVRWKDRVYETSYTVFRSEVNDTNFPSFQTDLPKDANVYTDLTLNTNTTYYFWVRANNSTNGNSQSPSPLAVTTLRMPPEAPSSLVAVANSFTEVGLSWGAASREEGFRIYQGSDATTNSAVLIHTSAAGELTYSITGLNPGVPYHFWVRGFNNGGNGPLSSVASVTTPMSVPTFTSIGSTLSNTMVLGWTQPLTTAQSYTLYRNLTASTSSGLVPISLAGNVTLYSDTTLVSNTLYYYYLRAVSSEGISSRLSAVTFATTLRVPPASSSLGMPIVSGWTQISLSWTSSARATSYQILRSTNSSTNKALVMATVPSSETGWLDNSVFHLTTYHYWVRAVNNGGVSSLSVAAIASTPAMPVPSVPVFKSAVAKGKSSIALAWMDVLYEMGYKVYCARVNSTNQAVLLRTLTEDSTNLVVNQLEPYTDYYFWVKSTNLSGASGFSATLSAKTSGPDEKGMVVWNNVIAADGAMRLFLNPEGTEDQGGSLVTVRIYSLSGVLVKEVLSKPYREIVQPVLIDAQGMASGVYLLHVQGAGIRQYKRIYVK